VPPNGFESIRYDAGDTDTFWCHFRGRISSKSARAAAQVRDDGGETRVLLPAQ
jgi:hypothetical protein